LNVVDASILVDGERGEKAEHAIRRDRWVWAPADLRTQVELIGES
jgi:hypothetical protein